MKDYIKAEFYRLLHKKSFIIWYGLIIIGCPIVIILLSNSVPEFFSVQGYTAESILGNSTMFYNFLISLYKVLCPLLFSFPLIVHVITNDFSANTLTNSFAGGMKRTTFVLSKILLVFGLNLFIGICCITTSLFAAYFLNIAVTFSSVLLLINAVIVNALLYIAYIALAAVIGYWTKRTSITLITYFFFSNTLILSQVFGLLSLRFSIFRWFDQHALYHYCEKILKIFSEKHMIAVDAAVPILLYTLFFMVIATTLLVKSEIKSSE